MPEPCRDLWNSRELLLYILVFESSAWYPSELFIYEEQNKQIMER